MEMANIQPLHGLYGSQINRENAVSHYLLRLSVGISVWQGQHIMINFTYLLIKDI